MARPDNEEPTPPARSHSKTRITAWKKGGYSSKETKPHDRHGMEDENKKTFFFIGVEV
jgi:hypothetical protein